MEPERRFRERVPIGATTGTTYEPAWATLPLRLMLGVGFLYHGIPKLFTAQGHEQFVGTLSGMGIPLPNLMAWVVGGVEVLGAVAILLGIFVRVASLALIVNMLVALFMVHLPHGFSFMNITGQTEQGPQFGMPGYEVNLLYIAMLAALFLAGPGKLAPRWRRKSAPVGVRDPTLH